MYCTDRVQEKKTLGGNLLIKKGKRKDAKKDIKPYVPIELKEAIFRLSFITRTPVMHITERFFMHALTSEKIRTKLLPYFKRDVYFSNSGYYGRLTNPTINKYEGETERIHFRINQEAQELLALYAYALKCSQARACAILLEESVQDLDFINDYIKTYLESSLDKEKMRELRLFMKYVNEGDTESSWAAMLSYITDEIKKPLATAQEVVNEFLIHHWRDR